MIGELGTRKKARIESREQWGGRVPLSSLCHLRSHLRRGGGLALLLRGAALAPALGLWREADGVDAAQAEVEDGVAAGGAVRSGRLLLVLRAAWGPVR